jgi:hypothetical protein
MVRVLVGMMVLSALLLVHPSPAGAAAEWCDTDPLVVIVTPAGNLVPVYVLVGALGIQHLAAAQAASLLVATDTAAAAGGRATRVTLTVRVPNDLFASGFPVRSAASTGPLETGLVYADTDGVGGNPMMLRFTLDVP